MLRQIETGISRSEPGLASMMAVFARLTADEDMPDHERWPSASVRIRGALVKLAVTVAVLGAQVIIVCLSGARVAAGALWSVACKWQAASRRSSTWGASWYD
jgi:hypothetical protein